MTNEIRKQIVERMEKLTEEQQRMVMATVRGMELANAANEQSNKSA